MQSSAIRSKVSAELNRYSQDFDIIQGPQVRHQFSLFFEECKDLSDNEFLQKVNDRYGFILDLMYKNKVLDYPFFFKIIVIVFIVVPFILLLLYRLMF